MKAFLVTSAATGSVDDVTPPQPRSGQVVVGIDHVGICGTDVSLFAGDPARLAQLDLSFPLRLGHEWDGRVIEVGEGVDPAWLGKRVTGDTMLGCGRCERCLDGRHHLCAERFEIGVRGNWPGALAERLLVPVAALYELPDAVTAELGAMVEPGANAWRSVHTAGVHEGSRVLVLGTGTIGLLSALFARAEGAEVHVLGRDREALELARSLGVTGAWTQDALPALTWDAVIDATNAASMPQFAVDVVEPGGRVVLVGISGEPSLIDSRVVGRKDVTVVGILGGSAGIQATIDAYASGRVDPLPLISRIIGLDEVAAALSGARPMKSSGAPKVLVDLAR
ncbi:alcohol dehydrogenase catalytic domain-containing protein [Herbiconiux sp. CPCC 205763]|uniref:Alcohol dehydrogenase catalytic domain-containing protein n=1 Tax=Herbiconiux aconitum TaxID=2970913 RepID=A0ABT2GT02_9MICO|nr:alcohol dehydrogenase catalytic domain-containing protein [Herbiconiux aconitum]MCS5717976.1 alcohol dehydrogenase catalytic domain-containing protein [Herbiconiux aconitum]